MEKDGAKALDESKQREIARYQKITKEENMVLSSNGREGTSVKRYNSKRRSAIRSNQSAYEDDVDTETSGSLNSTDSEDTSSLSSHDGRSPRRIHSSSTPPAPSSPAIAHSLSVRSSGKNKGHSRHASASSAGSRSSSSAAEPQVAVLI